MPVRIRSLFLLFLIPFLIGAGKPTDHPFHVGVIEIQHNASAQSMEVSCKLFTDDFEKGLNNRFKTPIDLISPARHAAMDSLVARYVREHLSLSVGGKLIIGKYLGYEQEKEAVYVYVEYAGVSAVSAIEAGCSLLYETFEDQINIFHVTVRGQRQSSKLNNPAHQIGFRF